MSVLHITEQEVARWVTMDDAIEAMETAFTMLAEGKAENIPRARARAPGGVLHIMGAAAEYLNLLGWKNYCTTRGGAQFIVGLHRLSDGQLAALIDANHLGQLRTGATTGVAIEALAGPEVAELGLFGTGFQAETQLEAACRVRPIKQAFVYSRDADRRADFARRMAERLNIEIEPVDRPQEAAADLPLVITATNSRTPVFDGRDLAEGTLVCAIGNNQPGNTEIDTHVVRMADNIVCDSIAACRLEAGDFAEALENGSFTWSRAMELSEVLTGRATGRNTRDSVVLFKSVGLAIEDVALGSVVLERAAKKDTGNLL
jgi:ornithine cyclodeaminase/alanine dehydrogenase-like protein (mu-crystallin family)